MLILLQATSLCAGAELFPHAREAGVEVVHQPGLHHFLRVSPAVPKGRKGSGDRGGERHTLSYFYWSEPVLTGSLVKDSEGKAVRWIYLFSQSKGSLHAHSGTPTDD